MGLFPNPLQRYKKYLIYTNKIVKKYIFFALFYNHSRNTTISSTCLAPRAPRALVARCVARFPRSRYAVRGVTPAARRSRHRPAAYHHTKVIKTCKKCKKTRKNAKKSDKMLKKSLSLLHMSKKSSTFADVVVIKSFKLWQNKSEFTKLGAR